MDRRFKNYFLLAALLLFYAWGEPKFVFVMIASILVNHVTITYDPLFYFDF